MPELTTKDNLEGFYLTDADEVLLNKFNWGAFLVSQFWCFIYKKWAWFTVFLAISMFFTAITDNTPFIFSWIMALVGYTISYFLGAKANRTLWESSYKNYGKVEIMLKRQRYWVYVGIPGNLLFLFILIMVSLNRGLFS